MGETGAAQAKLEAAQARWQAIPANRIAWGSNCPASKGTLKEMVDEAKAALSCLKQSDQDWIFAKTAQTLYPALAD